MKSSYTTPPALRAQTPFLLQIFSIKILLRNITNTVKSIFHNPYIQQKLQHINMAIYVKSLRERVQDLREENSEMQREIDLLVEQRDKEMKISERRLLLLQRERIFLWKEGYFFCLCVGGWTKRVRNTICVCEYEFSILSHLFKTNVFWKDKDAFIVSYCFLINAQVKTSSSKKHCSINERILYLSSM